MSFTLADSGSTKWLVTVTDTGLLQTFVAPGSAATVNLNDPGNATSWSLTITTGGVLLTTAIALGSFQTGIFLVSPNGATYNLQVTSGGIMYTTFVNPAVYSLPQVQNIGGNIILASSIEFTANFNTSKNVSPFTAKRQGYIFLGSSWSINFVLPPMRRSEAEPWLSFLGLLWGRNKKFLFGDPLNTGLLGSASGSPVVNGSNQAVAAPGRLSIRSLTGVLMPGDYFQIGSGVTSRLYKNLTQQGPGSVTLDIFPTLRDNPVDGTPLVLVNPVGVFRLADNSAPWYVTPGGMYDISFKAVEAVS